MQHILLYGGGIIYLTSLSSSHLLPLPAGQGSCFWHKHFLICLDFHPDTKCLSECIWKGWYNYSVFPGSNHGGAVESIFGLCVDDVLIIFCRATNFYSPSLSLYKHNHLCFTLQVRTGPFKSGWAANCGLYWPCCGYWEEDATGPESRRRTLAVEIQESLHDPVWWKT